MTTAVGADEEVVVDAHDGWRRLSPRMLAVHPVMELRRLIVPLGALLIGLHSGDGGAGGWWALGIGGIGIVVGFLRYFTTSFRITPTHVQVRRGLLRRRTLTVPRDRIRTVTSRRTCCTGSSGWPGSRSAPARPTRRTTA